MKQRDLLFAGLLLLGAPAFAQDGPTRTPQDAKIVFQQGFEASWDKWQDSVVDKITVLEYYDVENNHSDVSGKEIWKDADYQKPRIIRTDSVIELHNGAMLTDNATEIKDNKYGEDDFRIVDETTPERADEFEAYGEDGGSRVFSFKTGKRKGSDLGKGDRYRRNLFVRGLPIEDNTSYRLTFYAKGNPLPGRPAATPTISAGVFRGYFHSEKAFVMGIEKDPDNYKYLWDSSTMPQYWHSYSAIEYDFDEGEFSGNWDKFTMMTFYTNDSIQDNYVFLEGYYWASDSAWFWGKDRVGNTSGKDLYLIKQPDNFFVRIAFRGDSCQYYCDNVSLVKSYIAGAEYYGEKLRIDFGYKTNLKDLVKVAEDKTGIDAIEIENDALKTNFVVWGHVEGETDPEYEWEEILIRSAEYHSDGLLYMFTDDDGTGTNTNMKFDGYDTVLVTFKNPQGDFADGLKRTLQYTGDGKSLSGLFPKALDVDWIKAGKVVPDLYNEIATPNPNGWDDVYSMKNLPPVMTKAQWDEGAFGLPGNTTTLEFSFSRPVMFDAVGAATTLLKATVGNELWTAQYKEGDENTIIITRPSGLPALSGDYEVKLVQIKGDGTGYAKQPVIMHYHFGSFERTPLITFITQSDWRSHLVDFDFSDGETKRPIPDNVYMHTGHNNDQFLKGEGVVNKTYGDKSGTKIGLYPLQDDTITILGQKVPDNCLFYISNRKANQEGNVYAIEHLEAGMYAISFKFAGRSSVDIPMTLKFYPKPSGTLDNGNDKGFVTMSGVANKTILVENKLPKSGSDMGEGGKTKTWNDKVETLTYSFKVPTTGDYVFEWVATGSTAHQGFAIGNYWITTAGDLSFAYTQALNTAVADAQARLTLAADAKYAGAAKTALNAAITRYAAGGAFDGENKHLPKEWNAAVDEVKDATKAMKTRMDSVDLVVAKAKEVADKLTATLADNAKWEGLEAYTTLDATKTAINSLNYSAAENSNVKLGELIKKMDDEMKGLDTRLANTKAFGGERDSAKALLDAKEKESYKEYADLQAVYDDVELYDEIAATDADLAATIATVKEAIYNYNFHIYMNNVGTERVKALAKLATDLGSQIGDSALVKSELADLSKDNDELANVYKAAIKAAIYEKAATLKGTTTDLTPFIKNYYLYATPTVVEMTDKNQPDNRADFTYDAAKHGDANIAHTNHKWNKYEIWIMLAGKEFTDLFPGWTVSCVHDGGNDMIFVDTICPKKDAVLAEGTPVFDGALSMDWESEAKLTQEVIGLPAGSYELSIDVRNYYKYKERTNGSTGSKLSVKTKATNADKEFKTGYWLPDTLYVPNGGATPTGYDSIIVADEFVNDTSFVYSIANIVVADNDTMSISALLKTNHGNAQIDNFTLKFTPAEGVPYADLVAAAKADVNKALTIVNKVDAVAPNVEYYTLSGIKLVAPKQGEILIRKTTQSNGKIAVDKVIIK